MSVRVSTNFGSRLSAARDLFGPLCVGIDPHPSLLAQAGWADNAQGVANFCDRMMSAVAGRVTAIKPQSAFFERHGSAGIAVLERLLQDAAAAGTLTILDVKRGDIGSTMNAYAQAYLSPDSPLAADAITVSPYLGFESLRPALDLAAEHGRGVFVLALTSNAEGASVQHRGRPSVAEHVLESVARQVPERGTASALADIGAVIGAGCGTAIDQLGLRAAIATSTMPVLAPGVGAQGASPADAARSLVGFTDRVLTPVSRGMLNAGLEVDDIAAQSLLWRAELAEAMGTGTSP
ncbi:MAG: orotidine-5'-phosphate decarboxylase [Ornithinimicrobium sp.]